MALTIIRMNFNGEYYGLSSHKASEDVCFLLGTAVTHLGAVSRQQLSAAYV